MGCGALLVEEGVFRYTTTAEEVGRPPQRVMCKCWGVAARLLSFYPKGFLCCSFDRKWIGAWVLRSRASLEHILAQPE